jgi:hypothetical protein
MGVTGVTVAAASLVFVRTRRSSAGSWRGQRATVAAPAANAVTSNSDRNLRSRRAVRVFRSAIGD